MTLQQYTQSRNRLTQVCGKNFRDYTALVVSRVIRILNFFDKIQNKSNLSSLELKFLLMLMCYVDSSYKKLNSWRAGYHMRPL